MVISSSFPQPPVRGGCPYFEAYTATGRAQLLECAVSYSGGHILPSGQTGGPAATLAYAPRIESAPSTRSEQLASQAR